MEQTQTVKCTCSHCGAKYRLPIEAQGRKARCKKCGEHFSVPRAGDMEDSILAWLSEPDHEEDVVDQPRVINMNVDAADADSLRKAKGPIRMKATDSSKS